MFLPSEYTLQMIVDPGVIRGGLPVLQASQGMPAPQLQPSPSTDEVRHGMSEWFSHTHASSSQTGQRGIGLAPVSAAGRSVNPAILIRGLVVGRFRLPSWLRCAPKRDEVGGAYGRSAALYANGSTQMVGLGDLNFGQSYPAADFSTAYGR